MDTKTTIQHGKSEVRLEDDALVRGAGRFIDDARFPNQAFAAFVRSPHGHAKVVSVDTADAAKSKGVLAVLTGADMKAAGVNTAGKHPPLPGRGGKDLIQPFRPVLAIDRVRYVGEAVAMVVADDVRAAGFLRLGIQESGARVREPGDRILWSLREHQVQFAAGQPRVPHWTVRPQDSHGRVIKSRDTSRNFADYRGLK